MAIETDNFYKRPDYWGETLAATSPLYEKAGWASRYAAAHLVAQNFNEGEPPMALETYRRGDRFSAASADLGAIIVMHSEYLAVEPGVALPTKKRLPVLQKNAPLQPAAQSYNSITHVTEPGLDYLATSEVGVLLGVFGRRRLCVVPRLAIMGDIASCETAVDAKQVAVLSLPLEVGATKQHNFNAGSRLLQRVNGIQVVHRRGLRGAHHQPDFTVSQDQAI